LPQFYRNLIRRTTHPLPSCCAAPEIGLAQLGLFYPARASALSRLLGGGGRGVFSHGSGPSESQCAHYSNDSVFEKNLFGARPASRGAIANLAERGSN
jgi:hypothetical protein